MDYSPFAPTIQDCSSAAAPESFDISGICVFPSPPPPIMKFKGFPLLNRVEGVVDELAEGVALVLLVDTAAWAD